MSGMSGKIDYMAIMENDHVLEQYSIFQSRSLTPPSLDSPEPSQNLSIQEDTDISESLEIVGTDEFPLDNRFGSETLTVEQEVSKTVSNKISLERSTDLGG
jgi:hypothetical protein